MTIKKGVQLIIGLFLLQSLRIGVEALIFTFVDRTVLSDTIVSSIYLLLMIGTIVIVMRKQNMAYNVFPTKFTTSYKVVTIVLAVFMIITPIITKNVSIYSLFFLINDAIQTVVFEELLFRGYLWKQIETMKNKKYAYGFTTILFSLWHLGYIDTIIWRTAIFFPNVEIVPILIGKVITAFVIGLLVGYCRYRNQNVYSSILLHSFINTFGS